MPVEYRIIDDLNDLEKIVALEIEIWNLNPVDAVPSHILHTIAHNGGVLVAAYAGHEVIGLCLGFPALRDGEWFLWSHMAGVQPRFQGQGIGAQLKLMQRTWAHASGYKSIRWTFDPLQRGNANFNLHVLGATASIYHVNYYGEMNDAINAGLPSDRLEVFWKTTPPATTRKTQQTAYEEATFLLSADPDQQPALSELSADCIPLLIGIPDDLSRLKREAPSLALKWRLALRTAMQNAFEHHYTAVDFVRVSNQFAYVLEAPQPWFMYVVECNDRTLYTGITNDIGRRLQQHNRGKGAAYTATRRPVTLLAAWRFPDRSSALKAEAAFKKQSRDTKLAHIRSGKPYRSGTFVEPESQ